jgi:hypothetical protein
MIRYVPFLVNLAGQYRQLSAISGHLKSINSFLARRDDPYVSPFSSVLAGWNLLFVTSQADSHSKKKYGLFHFHGSTLEFVGILEVIIIKKHTISLSYLA